MRTLAALLRRWSPRLLPREMRRRLVRTFPWLPIAPRTFGEAGRRGDSAFFEAFYSVPDPYGLATSPRELAKFTALLAACGTGPFDGALEVACSVGVFTAMLAPSCSRLVAVDISENALRQARARCAHLPQVTFERRVIPRGFPPGPFQLIVASDVLYYFAERELRLFAERLPSLLAPGGRFVCLGWLGPVEAVGTSAAVSDFLRKTLPLRHTATSEAAGSILDVFDAPPATV